MPPKKDKKSKRKRKAKKIIDWSLDPHFNPNRAMIYIEHTHECPIFVEKAKELLSFLQTSYPEKMFQLILNDNGKLQPREGAFEISFAQNARMERASLWSGVDKGPPRREKFPTAYDVLLPEIDKIFKKVYVPAVPEIDKEKYEEASDV